MSLILNENEQKAKDLLFSTSLENLPDEEWKPIEGYEESYAISNYGRIKSLERSYISLRNTEKFLHKKILFLIIHKQFNQYLNKNTYSIRCSLSLAGKKIKNQLLV